MAKFSSTILKSNVNTPNNNIGAAAEHSPARAFDGDTNVVGIAAFSRAGIVDAAVVGELTCEIICIWRSEGEAHGAGERYAGAITARPSQQSKAHSWGERGKGVVRV